MYLLGYFEGAVLTLKELLLDSSLDLQRDEPL